MIWSLVGVVSVLVVVVVQFLIESRRKWMIKTLDKVYMCICIYVYVYIYICMCERERDRERDREREREREEKD